MSWTSQKFCAHGLEHGSGDEEGILQKLSKQFLIVIKLQGFVTVVLNLILLEFIFRIFITLSESRHKF